MQDDEFTLRFDTMTLEMICTQIIRIIKVSHRHDGEHWLEEGSETDAIKTLWNVSAYTLEAPLGTAKPLRVWHIIQQIIDCIGNMMYLQAEADRYIVSLPSNPALKAHFLPPLWSLAPRTRLNVRRIGVRARIRLLGRRRSSIMRRLLSSKRRNRRLRSIGGMSFCRS